MVNLLKSHQISTPLGEMIAIGDEEALWLLEFADRPDLRREMERLRKISGAAISPGQTSSLQQIQEELNDYFLGKQTDFLTPIRWIGTPFQIRVWEALRAIPHGKAHSYKEIAEQLGLPNHFRAVARANASNQLAIIVPCHRVVNADGKLGGYAGGLERKRWMLQH